MYDKQGLRLSLDGLGPGYAFEMNTLRSTLELFVGDEAAQGVADSESALEKSTASRGLLAVQPNEADLTATPTKTSTPATRCSPGGRRCWTGITASKSCG